MAITLTSGETANLLESFTQVRIDESVTRTSESVIVDITLRSGNKVKGVVDGANTYTVFEFAPNY